MEGGLLTPPDHPSCYRCYSARDMMRSLVKIKTPEVEIHRYPPCADLCFRRLFAVIREYLDARAGHFNFRPG